eukprot:3760042-Rhodomonas_salina.1
MKNSKKRVQIVLRRLGIGFDLGRCQRALRAELVEAGATAYAPTRSCLLPYRSTSQYQPTRTVIPTRGLAYGYWPTRVLEGQY